MVKKRKQPKKHIPTWSFNDPGYRLPVDAIPNKVTPFGKDWKPPTEGLRLKGENTTFGVKKKHQRKKRQQK